MAEHFRDAEGQDVLLFIDNIFRFTQVSYHCQLYSLLFDLCWISAETLSCNVFPMYPQMVPAYTVKRCHSYILAYSYRVELCNAG